MKKIITMASVIALMSFSALSAEKVKPFATSKQKYNVTVVKLSECPSMDKVLEAPKNLIINVFL